VRYSRNLITTTWLAWASARDPVEGEIARGLERVGRHYGGLLATPPVASHATAGRVGIAVWAPADAPGAWPAWSDDGEVVLASASPPMGRRRLIGARPIDAAPPALARALLRDPASMRRLDPPATLGALDRVGGRLVLGNDLLGCGRLYELEHPGGVVWSNRLGALPLFAGTDPELDERAWRVFAATGWFMGDATPLRGCRKVPPGAAIAVDREGAVERSSEDPRAALVRPRKPMLRARSRQIAIAAEEAAADVAGLMAEIAEVWSGPISIALTGGRDSRVSAAGAVASGAAVVFNTGDQVPGEVDTARALVAAAPGEFEHRVFRPEPESEPDDDLVERVARIHLVHDGMRNPQEARRATEVPHTELPPPTVSGHGGELGHGFYYANAAKLRRLQRGGERALLAQLDRNARRKHSAARPEAYRDYLEDCERVLELGRRWGLRGPALLDFFYMAERLPHRSGLGARTARYSACVVPGFIRGAFDLAPRDRLSARLHRAVVAQLVPAWAEIPFFRASDDSELPEIHRRRAWEREREAAVLSEVIAADGAWTEIFDAARVREMWSELEAGGGSADYEHVLDRIVWREAYERHLATLRAALRD
jgi:hypothetical protein